MTVLIFIAVLSLLVLVHEVGHFVAAKKSGCEVEEFGIGFPPRLFAFKKGETTYTINALPLGGFVKIKGENGDEHPDERSFAGKSYGWRAFIVSAGVLMNFLLAYVLITINLAVGVPAVVADGEDYGRYARLSEPNVAIVEVLKDSPAAKADLRAGDIIADIDGKTPSNVDEVLTHFRAETPQTSHLRIKRGTETREVNVTPVYIKEIDRNGIGIGLSQSAVLSYPWYVVWFYGLQRTWALFWLILTSFAGLIASLFTTGKVAGDIAGPVGIAVLTGEAARLGWTHLLQFVALLSLNLGIINILPFPALDGSRLLMLTIEQIRGKKMNVEIEKWMHIIGFSLLMILMLVVTVKDIGRYSGGIWQSITHLLG